jgi:hypothetical protein
MNVDEDRLGLQVVLQPLVTLFASNTAVNDESVFNVFKKMKKKIMVVIYKNKFSTN